MRAEPTKQKTRRPERRGITRAVSPKKKRKKKVKRQDSDLSTRRAGRRTNKRARFDKIVAACGKSPMTSNESAVAITSGLCARTHVSSCPSQSEAERDLRVRIEAEEVCQKAKPKDSKISSENDRAEERYLC